MKFGFGLIKIIPFLLFLVFFSVYSYSACKVNSGYTDSDEIVTAGYLLSVAHPPGYPLQAILTKLFILLPIGGSVAFRANIMSGFFGALAVMMVYLVGKKVMHNTNLGIYEFRNLGKKKEERKRVKGEDKNLDKNTLLTFSPSENRSLSREYFLNELVCITGAMMLGLSAQFWLFSSVSEVFALNNFFVILSVWLGLKWREEVLNSSVMGVNKVKSRIASFSHKHGIMRHDKICLKSVQVLSREEKNKELFYFVLTCVMIGIGLSHVQTIVLFLPGFAVLFFSSVWKEGKQDPTFSDSSHRIRSAQVYNSEESQTQRDDKPCIKSLQGLSSKGRRSKYLFKRVILGVLLVFVSFALINFLLFWLNSRKQNFSWYFPQNLRGLYQEVTRWVYTNYDLENGETSSAYFSGFNLQKFKAIPMYFGFLNEHFAYIGLVLGIVGIWFWWRNTPLLILKSQAPLSREDKSKPLFLQCLDCSSKEKHTPIKLKLVCPSLEGIIFWVFVIWFIFGGLFLGMYSGFQEKRPGYLFYDSNVGMMQRQYLQGEVIWVIFIMMGIWGIVKWLFLRFSSNHIGNPTLSVSSHRNRSAQDDKLCIKSLQSLSSEKKIWIGILTCGLLVGWMIFSNYKIGIQRNTTVAYDYAKTVLDSAERNSVIICLYDFPCFSLAYLQEVEGYRKDVMVVPRNRFFKYYFFDRNPEYYAYNYLDQNDYASALVYWNVQKRTTYVTDITIGNFNFGMYDGTFFVVPHGYLFEVRKDIPEEIYESNYDLTDNFLSQNKDKRNYWLNGIGDLLANIHYMQAKQYAFLGNQKKAMENIFLSQKLNKEFVQSKNLITEIASINKNPLFKVGAKIFKAEDFIKYARVKEQNGEVNLALANYQRATFVEPENKEARFLLANFYLKSGMIRQGFEEYRRLNLMFPEDKEIEKILNDLRVKLGIK